MFGENMVVFCGASGHKFLFSNEKKCVVTWWPRFVDKVALFPEFVENFVPEDSIKVRRAIVQYLKPEALQYFIPIMDSMAKEHLEADWSPNKQVKVFPLTMKYKFSLACRLFLSVTDPNHVARLSDIFALIINDENGRFMDDMLNATNIMALIIGGHETTTTTITFVMKYLAENPHVYSEVFKEQMEIAKFKGPNDLLNWDDIKKMKYSWNVACETLRLTPPLIENTSSPSLSLCAVALHLAITPLRPPRRYPHHCRRRYFHRQPPSTPPSTVTGDTSISSEDLNRLMKIRRHLRSTVWRKTLQRI
nr:beta-amyrin 28-oxidase [Quercus suber]